MTDSKKKHYEGNLSREALPSSEYTEKVSRYLFVCIQGICDLLADEDPLLGKLNSLKDVVKKVLRPARPQGLVVELGEHFAKLKLEKDFSRTETDELKQIILELSLTIKEMSDSAGLMDHDMGGFIDKIQASESISDMAAVREGLIRQVQAIRGEIKLFSSTVQDYRKVTDMLSERFHRAQVQAMVDSLTNVLNRAAYDLKVGQVIREYARYKEPTALVLVDIDHFKKFNDTYGHKAGDMVLKSVASSITASIRESDYLFRYGGEEFVVVLSRIHRDDAAKLADKIRCQVEKDYYIHDGNQLKVTVSLGVSVLREGDTEKLLFERADQAMYAAKGKGRNRVNMAD